MCAGQHKLYANCETSNDTTICCTHNEQIRAIKDCDKLVRHPGALSLSNAENRYNFARIFDSSMNFIWFLKYLVK
jgi:benzoyl-CoA reductase/2-hydroxyglutaryl-CoA dehydratase subunit BcrC/BadD/HgdB